MRKLLPLIAALAVPAAMPAGAQESRVYYASDSWPVQITGRTCTLVQAGDPDGGLAVSYDGREVTLATTNRLETALAASGTLAMGLVFLDNGRTAYDDGWGSRPFAYSRDDGAYRFSTRFSGERNVRQILADLSASSAVGFMQGGEAVISYELTGIAPSLARLQRCAETALAAN